MSLPAEASGSQAANEGASLQEHDYIGMSSSEYKKKKKKKLGLGKELHMRRTELQLGLPGSPEEAEEDDEDGDSAAEATDEARGQDGVADTKEKNGGFGAMQQQQQQLKNEGGHHHLQQPQVCYNHKGMMKLGECDIESKANGPKIGVPNPAGFAKNSRGFGAGNGAAGADAPSWHLQQQQQQQRSSSSSSSCHLKDLQQDCVEKHVVGAGEDPAGAQSRAPVGWPPVQSFRKNSLNAPAAASQQQSKEIPAAAAAAAPAAVTSSATATAGTSSNPPSSNQPSSQFIKVYMDGVPIGRKVNLRTHSSYEKLSIALEEMFRRFINGQSATNKTMKDKLLSESKKFNFIYGSDYVLTYEDKDGDLMLVGDVPWGMFVGTVKRLRIMKGSEAIGLAPRAPEEQATAAK